MEIFMYVLLGTLFAASIVARFRTRNGIWLIPATTFLLLLVANWFDAGGLVHAIIITLGLLAFCVAIQRYRNGRTWPFTTLGVMVLVASLVYGIVSLVNPTSDTANDNVTPPANSETVKALTVTASGYTCKKTELSIGALKSVEEDGRANSDAISTPFEFTKPAPMVGELRTAICTDPLLGAAVLNFFANQGPEMLAANPWLRGFEGTDADVINNMAFTYVALHNEKDLSKAKIAERDDLEDKWRVMASMAITLLSRFDNPVIATGQPILGYHLFGSGPVVSGIIPSVALDDQKEARSALRLTLTSRGGQDCLMVIGFDVTGKNPARYSC